MAKTLGLHVGDAPEDAELEKYILGRAQERFSKKVSSYLRYAVMLERDSSAYLPDTASPTIMTDLTRRLLGDLDAEEMEKRVGGLDQRKVLADVLRRYLGINHLIAYSQSHQLDFPEKAAEPAGEYNPADSVESLEAKEEQRRAKLDAITRATEDEVRSILKGKKPTGFPKTTKK